MMSVEKKAMIAMAIIVTVTIQACVSIVIPFLWLVFVFSSVKRVFPFR